MVMVCDHGDGNSANRAGWPLYVRGHTARLQKAHLVLCNGALTDTTAFEGSMACMDRKSYENAWIDLLVTDSHETDLAVVRGGSGDPKHLN